MVVPLSIAFGQRQRTLRRLFEKRCEDINTRYYDNIPDTTIQRQPRLKSWKIPTANRHFHREGGNL